MTTASDNTQQGASHLYRAMRDFVQSSDDTLPGKFEITKEGIVHDMMSPSGRHELTTLRLRKRLEKVMPEEIVAHTGEPDVEDEPEGVMRRPDLMVIAEEDMDIEGSFDPRSLIAAVEVVSRSNPRNDWVGKVRDYPLLGIPVYAVFDPRTGTGAVFTDIHSTSEGPRYAVRKDFVYGEDVTIGEWTISTAGLPRYQGGDAEQDDSPGA
ncbi:Uma2 family endonuclease [Streptomyces coelicoflavus]|uniref:Uma2 family endonuclease n=1 Tax=Streptomyces coelicoflavus TaxID=285562 RepID=A0A7K3PGV6_9ACTN|nr:Uma2 family endonuclease [Streptomyces coelicoflavus]NEB08581.1 Uma2 family endonuclease [Streptomyces coelicoflavus]